MSTFVDWKRSPRRPGAAYPRWLNSVIRSTIVRELKPRIDFRKREHAPNGVEADCLAQAERGLRHIERVDVDADAEAVGGGEQCKRRTFATFSCIAGRGLSGSMTKVIETRMAPAFGSQGHSVFGTRHCPRDPGPFRGSTAPRGYPRLRSPPSRTQSLTRVPSGRWRVL